MSVTNVTYENNTKIQLILKVYFVVLHIKKKKYDKRK